MKKQVSFDELYEEVEDVTPINNENAAKMNRPLDKRDEVYTQLVGAYKDYYKDKSKVNIELRKCFLWLSFSLLFVLVGGCVAIGIIGCYSLNGVIAILVPIVTSVASITTSVLVLPRIIGKYLFPPEEDKEIKDLIKGFKDSDDSRRLNNKAEQ